MPDSWGPRQVVGTGGLVHPVLLCRFRFGQASDEDVGGSPALHAAALVGSISIVADEVGVEADLHGRNAFMEVLVSHDAKVLVEQGAVQALDEALGLRPSGLCGAVLDLFRLEDLLVGAMLGPAALWRCVWRPAPETVRPGRPTGGQTGGCRRDSRIETVTENCFLFIKSDKVPAAGLTLGKLW